MKVGEMFVWITSKKKNDEDYLMHYGVKGMKWGVRRKSNDVFQRDGSKRTVKKLNKILVADKKYGSNRSVRQDKKINKLYRKYDKSVSKDIKRASKAENVKAVNSMTAGRTFMRMMMDSKYFQSAINDTAVRANVESGKKFTYNFLRDDNAGGVKITVNGFSNTYAYLPELDTK